MKIEERLNKLEKEVACLTKALEKAENESQDIPKEIRANSFQLVDGKGKVRGGLSFDQDKSNCIFLKDINGKQRIIIKEDGIAIMSDDKEKSSLLISTDGSFFSDKNNSNAVDLSKEGLVLYDKKGNIRSMLTADDLVLYGESKKARLQLGGDQLVFRDENENVRVFISIGKDGTPSLHLLDAQRNNLAIMKVDKDCGEVSVVFDKGKNYSAVRAGKDFASYTLRDKNRKIKVEI